jgi:F-type H+-transporting ATPase subunit epsilon
VATLQLDIVTPTGSVVSREVERVQACSVEGYFEILPRHTEFLSALAIGQIRYSVSGKERKLAAGMGIAEIADNKVTLLVESAEPRSEIDIERAKESKKRAEKRISESKEGMEFDRAALSLQRAIIRLKVAGR